MIIPKDIIRSIVDKMPDITYAPGVDKKPQFGWGNKKELDRYLAKKRDAAYPLVWLLPDTETVNHVNTLVTRRCRFVIGTLEITKAKYNPTRLQDNFKTVLYVVLTYLIQGLQNGELLEL